MKLKSKPLVYHVFSDEDFFETLIPNLVLVPNRVITILFHCLFLEQLIKIIFVYQYRSGAKVKFYGQHFRTNPKIKNVKFNPRSLQTSSKTKNEAIVPYATSIGRILTNLYVLVSYWPGETAFPL